MASGRVHAAVTTGIALPAAVISSGLAGLAFGPDYALVLPLAATAGSLTGLVLNPDTDQVGLDAMEHKLLRRTGGLWAIWIGMWYVYARAIPHRSLESHAPFIGTLLRVLYLHLWPVCGLVIWPVLYLALSSSLAAYIGYGWVPVVYAGWFYGLALADALHWVWDGFPMRAGDPGRWVNRKATRDDG